MALGFEQSSSGCELVNEVARRFGEVRLRATGYSMLPAVRPGDILTVRRCGISELQSEQIALYRRNGKVIAHRVLNIQPNLLITRGDSVRSNDPPVSEAEIVGQVVSITRRGRTVPCSLSFWSRAASRILRRSSLCLRAATLLARGLRRPDNEEISWAR